MVASELDHQGVGMSSDVVAETSGTVTTVTLNRLRRRHALTRRMIGAIRAVVASAEDAGSRVIILTGADGCFSAGADISELEGTSADLSFDDALEALVADLHRASMLSIAAIEGPCMGAALDLALACEVRVSSATAACELPALRLGLLYNPSSLARVQARLSQAAAARLLLLCERIEGPDTLAAGIATHVCEAGQALATAVSIAQGWAAASKRAATATKHLLGALERGAFDLAAWNAIRMQLLDSPERHVAVSAAKARMGVTSRR